MRFAAIGEYRPRFEKRCQDKFLDWPLCESQNLCAEQCMRLEGWNVLRLKREVSNALKKPGSSIAPFLGVQECMVKCGKVRLQLLLGLMSG